MASLNLSPSSHGSTSETYSDGSTIQYNVYPSSTKDQNDHIVKVQRAMDILDNLATREPASGRCNAYFQTLGAGRSFSSLWQDPAVWVNHSPSVAIGFYAACHSNNRDLTVTAWCLATQNRWMVAGDAVPSNWHTLRALLVAARMQPSGRAERCYFGPQYDPTIMGFYRQSLPATCAPPTPEVGYSSLSRMFRNSIRWP